MPTLRLEKTDTRPKGVKRIGLVFRLLPTLSQVPLSAMWVTQDHVRDILLFFAGDRKHFPAELQDQPGVGGLKGNIHEGAKQILNLPNIPKFEGAVVEAIMGEILRMPTPAHPTVYYGCMMIELCKLQSTLHPALGAAINYLFEKIPYMQVECADRLADWLSFHLSNLDFKWLWRDWTKVVEQPRWALQRRWVCKVLDRCLRLAYPQRITSVLKAENGEALVALLLQDQSAVFPMGEEHHPLKTVADQVCDMVSLAQRQDSETLQEFVSAHLSNLPSDQPSAERAKILVAAMVYEGRESFSHVLGILGRYLPVLRNSIESEEEQCAAAEAVALVWSRSNAMCVMVMDKMVAMKLISPITLVRWLLSDYELCRQRNDIVWELLVAAINKPVALVKTVRKDLAAAQKELEELKVSLGPGEHPSIDEKLERIGRIKAVLRSSLRDQDDIIVGAIRLLIELGNQCFERLGGLAARATKRRRHSEDSEDDDAESGKDDLSKDDMSDDAAKSKSGSDNSKSSSDEEEETKETSSEHKEEEGKAKEEEAKPKKKTSKRKQRSSKVKKIEAEATGNGDAEMEAEENEETKTEEEGAKEVTEEVNEEVKEEVNEEVNEEEDKKDDKECTEGNEGKEEVKDGMDEDKDDEKEDDTQEGGPGVKRSRKSSPAARAEEEEDEETVWMRVIRGRLMHIARTFAAQIYECHEMLEDEVQPIKIDDPDLRRLVATVQRIR